MEILLDRRAVKQIRLSAQDAVEELEETARLFLLLRHEKVRCLTPDQVAEIARRFGAP